MESSYTSALHNAPNTRASSHHLPRVRFRLSPIPGSPSVPFASASDGTGGTEDVPHGSNDVKRPSKLTKKPAQTSQAQQRRPLPTIPTRHASSDSSSSSAHGYGEERPYLDRRAQSDNITLTKSAFKAPTLPPRSSSSDQSTFSRLKRNASIGLATPLLASIGNTTSNFTRRFPRSASERAFVALREDREAEDAPLLRASESGCGVMEGIESFGNWNVHKCLLLLSVVLLFGLGLGGLLMTIGIWYRAWPQSDVIQTADPDILIFLSVSTITLLLTSLVGISGTILNSRPLLACYNLMLWPSFISLLIMGYTSYKRKTFSLAGKLSESWSRRWGDVDRLVIQNSLHCCGFYNVLHESTFSKSCYTRSILPGCKGVLFRFEQESLQRFYTAAFAILPFIVLAMFIAMLCSNHVNQTFGKGLTPKQYRLSMSDVNANARLVLLAYKDTRIPLEPNKSHDKRSMKREINTMRNNGMT